jgi:hypothetical protein
MAALILDRFGGANFRSFRRVLIAGWDWKEATINFYGDE